MVCMVWEFLKKIKVEIERFCEKFDFQNFFPPVFSQFFLRKNVKMIIFKFFKGLLSSQLKVQKKKPGIGLQGHHQY